MRRKYVDWVEAEEYNPYQGEWICETRDDDYGYIIIKGIKVYKCSKCNYQPIGRHTDFNFCPNCGADMRENGYTKGEET